LDSNPQNKKEGLFLESLIPLKIKGGFILRISYSLQNKKEGLLLESLIPLKIKRRVYY
jgi:hypothetical protein